MMQDKKAAEAEAEAVDMGPSEPDQPSTGRA